MSRSVSIGALIGIVVGFIGSFIFSSFSLYGLEYEIQTRHQLGIPFFLPTSGSIFANSILILPTFLGLVGALIGLVCGKMRKQKS